jgi:DNA polymerase bacteriophage-type
MHPSTEVLCVGWSGIAQWRMGQELPADLFLAVEAADVVEAHNSSFEHAIWRNVCVRKYGWPEVPDEKWRCSAAKAAACGLSRHLGEGGRMLGLAEVKDEEGKKDMLVLSRGKKLNDEGTWQSMLAYNRQDVRAEEALSNALPDLSKTELALWQCSERMNRRGFPIDREGAKAALQVIREYSTRVIEEFQMTTGLVAPTQRAKFILWLNRRGVSVADTQAKTLDGLLSSQLPSDVRRAIEILRAVGRSSTAKYETILRAADSDDRVRGCFLFHGAGTGRWAGRLVQPHNFPKGDGDYFSKSMDEAWTLIHQRDVDVFSLFDTDPIAFCAGALRGIICAPEGWEFLVADYSSIEARVVAWLADQKALLKLFNESGDVYLTMAESIYNRKLVKKIHKMERQLGKQAILGLGFGMGYMKFLLTCRAYDITFTKEQICSVVSQTTRIDYAEQIRADWDRVSDTFVNATGREPDFRRDLLDLVFMKFVVNKYRAQYPEIPYLWSAYEETVKNAVRYPGQTFKTHRTAWRCDDRFLMCKLPSGRILRYFHPRLGSGGAVHYLAAKGDTNVFTVQSTYGGKITENIVQATARDIMGDAMLRIEDSPPYDKLIMTVHDELVSEIPKGAGDVHEFERLVSATRPWAAGLPVGAEAWRGRRYRK